MKTPLALLLTLSAFAQTPVEQAIAYMAAQTHNTGFMGTVLIAREGKVLFSNGYGYANVEHKVLNTPDTKFRIGSVTKQFTAAAILQLEEQGKLKVTDQACNYLPNCPADWQPITIHQLLTHTSGLPNYTEDREYAATTMLPSPPEKTLAKIRTRPLDFPPGTRYTYSNSGYAALAIVIEKAAGASYADYVQKHIFTPAGMTNSGHDTHSAILPNRATGYEGLGPDLRHAPFIDMSIPTGAGDLYSTVHDLLLWDQALYTNTILKPASLARLYTPDKDNYAYGWMIGTLYNRQIYFHSGSVNGFRAYILRFPAEKLVSIVLSNNLFSSPTGIARDLAALFLGEKLTIPKIRTAIQLPPDSLDRYIGKYPLAPTAILSVTREGTRLFAQLTGQGKIEIFPESATSFFPKLIDATITFTLDASGKATSLTLNQNGRQMPAQRVP